MGAAQGDVVVPPKDKKALRNEQRRRDKIAKTKRVQMSATRKLALRSLMHDITRSVSDLVEPGHR
jgi:hypothetical protein